MRSCTDWFTLGQHLLLNDEVLVEIKKILRQMRASRKAKMAKLMVLNRFVSKYNRILGGTKKKLLLMRRTLNTLNCKDELHSVGKCYQ